MLRTLGLTIPTLLDQDDVPLHVHLTELLKRLYSLLPNFSWTLQCKSCHYSSNETRLDPVIYVNKVQSNLSKTLIVALESSLKRRIWCEQCSGYRDFTLASDLVAPSSFVFIIDPSLYRSYHVVEEELSLKREQKSLVLQVIF